MRFDFDSNCYYQMKKKNQMKKENKLNEINIFARHAIGFPGFVANKRNKKRISNKRAYEAKINVME